MTISIDYLTISKDGGWNDPAKYTEEARLMLARIVLELRERGWSISGGSGVQLPDGTSFDFYIEGQRL